MKNLCFLLSFVACLNLYSQGLQMPMNNMPSPNGAPSGATPSATPTVGTVENQGGLLESQTFERSVDKLFDVDSDSLNLEDGTLNWKGKTFNIGNSRIVKARFEKYLSLPVDSSQLEAYQAIISEITSQLAANNSDLDDDVIKASWNRLFDAAEYDVDADTSLLIANTVYLSWRMKNEFRKFNISENEKESEMLETEFNLNEQNSFLEYAKDRLSNSSTGKKGKARTEGTTKIASLTKDLVESQAEFASAKSLKEAAGVKAILQFQSQVVAFIMQRNFQQAQIASMFYRHIYRGNAQDLLVGKKEIASLVPATNFLPTIDFAENVAREARRDVAESMKSITQLYEMGQRYSALNRLMEAFILGENEIVVKNFEYEKKALLHRLYNNAATIKELADNKDWNGIEQVLQEIKEDGTKDFPEREILAKLNTAKRASNMYLMQAKQAAAINDKEELKTAMTSAMQYWPLNPAIEEFNEELLGYVKGATQYIQKFDDFYNAGNFRAIVNEAPEFAISLSQDTKRAKALRDIIVKISQIDAYLAQIEELQKQNNNYLAWDILENAKKLDSADPKLLMVIADLAPKVADYIKALSKAEFAEKNNDYAAALNYYLAAKKVFPASQPCRLAIERISNLYLN